MLVPRSSACSKFQVSSFRSGMWSRCRSDCLLKCDEFEEQSITVSIRLSSLMIHFSDLALAKAIARTNVTILTVARHWLSPGLPEGLVAWNSLLLYYCICAQGFLHVWNSCLPFFSSSLSSARPLSPSSSPFDAVYSILSYLHSLWAALLQLFTSQIPWAWMSYT